MKFAAVFTLTTTNLGVEINLRPLDSRLIWSRVSSESERFLIYRFCDSSVFFIDFASKLFSPFVAFLSMNDSLWNPFPFRLICRHKRDIEIRFRPFTLLFLKLSNCPLSLVAVSHKL